MNISRISRAALLFYVATGCGKEEDPGMATSSVSGQGTNSTSTAGSASETTSTTSTGGTSSVETGGSGALPPVSTDVEDPSSSGSDPVNTAMPDDSSSPSSTDPSEAPSASDTNPSASDTSPSASGSAEAPTACPPACGPTTDEFYANDKVASIHLTIAEADLDGYLPNEWLQRLFDVRDQCDKEYVRAEFSYESPDGVGDVTLQDVGIRARGSMALSVNEMKGFKVNFHKPFYEEANPGAERRRFADINRLNTLSLEPAHSSGLDYDQSRTFQCLTYKLMRNFDVLAPQCNHIKVYVNDEYYGLMQNVEETDHGRFLAHRFGSTDGMMVEASPSMSKCGFGDGDGNLKYEGDTMADYLEPPRYVLERGTEADAEANLFPMFKCADASSTPDDEAYKTCISDWLDVEEWLRLIAAESIIPELETLAYDRNVNLYFKPDDAAPHGGRWLVSIWDVDATLNGQTCGDGGSSGGGLGGGFGGGGGGTATSACDPMTSISSLFGGSRLEFVTRLTRVFKTEYCQALNDFLTDVYKPEALDEMAAAMEPAMTEDPVDTQQDWLSAVAVTRDFIESNAAAMRERIDSACN
jgi:spore coat protein CotH